MRLGKRRLQENKRARSFFLILPQAWIRDRGLRKGTTLEVEEDGGRLILTAPASTEE